MRNILPLSILAVLLATYSFSCQTTIQQRFLSAEEMGIIPDDFDINSTKKKPRRGPCYNKENYQIDTNYLDHFPMRYIRVNFHWMNSEDGLNNIPEIKVEEYSKKVLHAMNYALENNKKMWLPHNNDTPVHPINIQYVLTGRPDDPNDDGIYYHYDDSLFYYVHIKKKDANLFSREVFNKYGVQMDTVLNIFLMPHHPDSISSKTYPAESVGVALRNAVKVAAVWKPDYERDPNIFWSYRGVINHEIGHILGLGHAWTKSDGCDDTPVHRNRCWNRSQAGCDTMTSNNIMDYCVLQLAWTPCQIAKVHLKMLDERNTTRKFLIPTWCDLNEDKNILIRDSIVWPCMKDLEGNLTIASNAQLTIHCRVSMPIGSTITIQAGGKLILDGGRLHQDCGGQWKGIVVEKQADTEGIFEITNEGSIEDVKVEINP